jgi:hypothetical protein
MKTMSKLIICSTISLFSNFAYTESCTNPEMLASYKLASKSEITKKLFLELAPEKFINDMNTEEVISYLSITRTNIMGSEYCDRPSLDEIEKGLRKITNEKNVSIYKIRDHIIEMAIRKEFYKGNNRYNSFVWWRALDTIANFYGQSKVKNFPEYLDELTTFKEKMIQDLNINVIYWSVGLYPGVLNLSNKVELTHQDAQKIIKDVSVSSNKLSKQAPLIMNMAHVDYNSDKGIILYNPDLTEFSDLYATYKKSKMSETSFFQAFKTAARKDGSLNVSKLNEVLVAELKI